MLIYDALLQVSKAGIRVAAMFSPKAKLWVSGRKNIFYKLRNALPKGEKRIWIHAASLGEYEQGRPVMQRLRTDYPAYKILLTFFSPSGYEVAKNHRDADYCFYLPMDSKRNAAEFVEIVQPSLAIFVKYEFWHYYLETLAAQKIPTILVSGIFHKEFAYFKWYGSFFRKMLSRFSHYFMQDEESKKLLASIGITENVTISGDTRYDRVCAIARAAKPFPEVAAFCGESPVLIGGSTWPEDEKVIKFLVGNLPENWKFIVAPHEVHEQRISGLRSFFGEETVLYSELINGATGRILIIDNIGLLSRLYQHGTIAFVGGGFAKSGIHNVLEPAVFGLPVLFGPFYDKFAEAKSLVDKGYAASIEIAVEGLVSVDYWIQQPHQEYQERIREFVADRAGATEAVMQWLRKENRL